MQTKPPLACHANLVAEWGGVAAREGSRRGGLRESGFGSGREGGGGGGGWLGDADESIMCTEVQQ